LNAAAEKPSASNNKYAGQYDESYDEDFEGIGDDDDYFDDDFA